MAKAYSARQARALFGKAKSEGVTAAAGPKGACFIIRPGPRTKVVCQEMSAGECNWIDAKLQAEGAGHTRFVAGSPCSK